ncbi:MAG: transposase [Ruminococcus sp.]|nr:transposase [Ruminococcus sp.]
MRSYPQRKPLRLKNHDYSQPNAYFITICTYRRQSLFWADEGLLAAAVGAHPCVRPPGGGHFSQPEIVLSKAGEMVSKWLKKIPEKYPGYTIDEYVIMPDHIHFIIICEEWPGGHVGPPLQSVLQWFKAQTTNEYIRGVRAEVFPPFNSRIWQRTYYEHIIRDQNDMQDIRRYIEENPIKWNTEKEEEYPWN